MRSIERHAASFRHRSVDEIDVETVLSILMPLWLTKAESAGKLRERLERVLDYARVKKLRTGPNPAVWKGNLIPPFAAAPQAPARPHAGHILRTDSGLHEATLGQPGHVRPHAGYSILTVARETMILEAVWGEIRADVWALDPTRMKDRQPLSTGGLSVLKAVRPTRRGPTSLSFLGRRAGRCPIWRWT